MIHEGPLLEYAGRDLALLQWAAAARHGSSSSWRRRLFLPHPTDPWLQLAVLPVVLVALCGALAAHRDARRQDADPARAATPRHRGASGAARRRRVARGGSHERTLAWAVVALGLAVVVVRRRSVAVALVTAQALLLAGVAFAEAENADDATAALALAVRGVALAALFLVIVSRTREPRPVRAGVTPFARAGLAIGLALALTWLVPSIGLESGQSERAMLALVAFGAAVVATRRATLHQLLGIVLVENGIVLGR